jgi:hypothetical protein
VDIDEVCEVLSGLLGKPVRCVPCQFRDERVVGKYVDTADAHLIFIEEEFAGDQRRKVFFHEIAHLMFDDPGQEGVESSEALGAVKSGVRDEDVRRVVCDYTATDVDPSFWNPVEVDAEKFALVILAWNAELRVCNNPAQEVVAEARRNTGGVGPDGTRSAIEVVFDDPRGAQ